MDEYRKVCEMFFDCDYGAYINPIIEALESAGFNICKTDNDTYMVMVEGDCKIGRYKYSELMEPKGE